ncbi:MAG: MFS transporter [Bacteroidales bacterium]|nr:MFS transporter [Bacteroidales bacterium]
MKLKIRLIVMNFLQYAVWGAYLTCMGKYLGKCDLGGHIGMFYAMQGIVSLFMPALMGIVADRWIPAQKTLGLCHLIAGAAMIGACMYGISTPTPDYGLLMCLYAISVAFYMPTIALSNSVAYNALEKGGLDTVKDFPPIRVFGTIGFICAMWAVDLIHLSDGFLANCLNDSSAFLWAQHDANTLVQVSNTPFQFLLSGILGIILGIYSFTLPKCEINKEEGKKSFVEALGLQAFSLFKQKKMAIFFIFSMLLGAALQITNGFATPFISSFAADPAFADTFGVKYSVIIYSISQIAETLCILLIPFCLKRFGIKKVMLMAMIAWFFRFGLFGIGNTGSMVWAIILSMIVYGFAFDFYNISGSLFVNQETDPSIRSSAQGLFMMMTNGVGATIGTLSAQAIVNHFCTWNENGLLVDIPGTGGWQAAWFIFAGYALVVAIMFAICFKYKHDPNKMQEVK